jgi:hypothetical protein
MAIDVLQAAQEGPLGPTPGALGFLRSGSFGELVVTQLFGKYAELTRRGYVYAARSGAAAAIPINTTLTNSPTLWNVSSSNKLVYPLQILLSPAAIGTPVLQGFTLSYLLNTGDVAAANNPLATFTNVAPVQSNLRGGACKTKFANAVVTFTTQPAALMDIGFGHWIEGTAASGGPGCLMYDIEGTVVMPPGTSISVGSATTATSTTYWTTIIFAELPLPALYS